MILAISTINFIIVARFLGPEGRGTFFLFISVVMVLAVFSDMGMSQSAVVFSADPSIPTRKFHRVILQVVGSLSILWAAVGGIIFFFAGEYLLPDFPLQFVWIAVGVLPLVLYANVWNSMMVGLGRIVQLNTVQVAITGASLLLNIIFVVWLRGGVDAAVGVYVGMAFSQVVIMLVMMHYLTSEREDKEPAGDLFGKVLGFGLRGYLNSLSSVIWTRCNIFLLNFYHGAMAVGIFSVGLQLAERMFIPGQALQDVLYQKVTAFSRGDATVVMNRFLRLSVWGVLALLIIGVGIGPMIVPVIFGGAYSKSVGVFQILVVGGCVMNLPLVLAPYFLGQLRRPGLLSALAWMNVMINVGLSLILIPAWAETGSSIALAVTQLVGTAVVFLIYLRASRSSVGGAAWLRGEDIALAMTQAYGLISRRTVEE